MDLQRREWGEHAFGCWVAVERSSSNVIGYVGLSVPTFLPDLLPAVEVGWRLDPRRLVVQPACLLRPRLLEAEAPRA